MSLEVKTDDEYDLHGMNVKDAIAFCSEKLRKGEGRVIRFITGRGLHSNNRRPTIRKALEGLLDRMKVPYTEDNKRGVVVVDLKNSNNSREYAIPLAMNPISSRRSPRTSPRFATRSQTRSHHNESEESYNSEDRSYLSSHSGRDNSYYNSSPLQSSVNDSDSADKTASHSSTFSESPAKSNIQLSNKMYPDLSDELDESGDSSFTGIRERKMNNLYPHLDNEPVTTRRYREVYTPSPSKSNEPEPYDSERKCDSDSSPTIIYFCVGVAVSIVVLLYLVSGSNSVNENTKSGFDYFEDELKTMRGSFPKQTNRFWATIAASARHVFEQTDPCYPSVILMATHSRNQHLNTCLAKKIAMTFSSSFNVSSNLFKIADVEDFKHMDSDGQKLHLDTEMQKAFQGDGGKAFVISNVHSLSPRAALLLHGFCDGDNAPFKDVMIILTFQVSDATIFKSVNDVEGYLTDLWSRGLDMDKLSALMSRVANNPVVLMEEDVDTVRNLCV